MGADATTELTAVCQDLHAEADGWRTLVGMSAEESANAFNHELDELARLPDTLAIDASVVPRDWRPLLVMLELGTVHVLHLAQTAFERLDATPPLLWPDRSAQKGTLVLYVLATNLGNTLLACRRLIDSGFDAQARVVLRSHVELADTAVAIAADYDLFTKYRQTTGNFEGDYEHWRRHLAPGRVRRILEIVDTLPGIDPSETAWVHKLRSDTYRWLSVYSHANWLAQSIGALARPMHNCEKVVSTIGGYVTAGARATLFYAGLYNWLTVLQLTWLLHNKHGWDCLADDRRITWLAYRSAVLTQYVRRNYPDMQRVADADIPGAC